MKDTAELQQQLDYYQQENNELRQRVDELSDFFENAAVPLHWVDAKGIIIWANQAELDALGYSRTEYIGFPISDFHADPATIQDILTRLTNNETLYDYAARLKCKDGSIKHVLINSNVLRKNGEFIHTRCFTRDVTGKMLEDQRKNDFVSMVSHELKTPLTAINSYVQLLLKNYVEKTGDNRLAIMLRIQAQTKKMIAMVHDFLNLARIEHGKIQLHRQQFDLQPLVEEIAADAQLLTSIHTLELNNFAGISLYADRDKIGQVLINLVSNAVKYSPNGGPITIGCQNEMDKVRIYVSDQGMGISPVEQQRLFQRFYRSDNEKIRHVSGFGIGLYLVSEILRQHNSQIRVESRENEGSTFFFELDRIKNN
ncbi:PAS domain-containing sensor histidine kinase [Pedobacter xixiisoli]|uniref:histidine kinase n=1 Tax=Pedobacter xixiisoli TaxID=1476464 RepID=A0A285ZWE5_9SPHI|nr:ATP-binding protein [Pedobacter xixiisoli]SOD13956.1 PAS domain S-box-containing protein [Pedobacter xixiisoli]